ncbi:MAG: outer membrane beta-barrel protein [Chitinophagaceae bacterium]|nr:outer membrane beta-barrel protein [Chitinophagaceae bacterium]
MKKIAIIVFLCIGYISQAQESDSKFSAQVGFGLSIPLGRFAHTSFSFSPHDTSGNAVTGFSGDVLLKYQLNKSLGISFLIGGSINGQDKEYLKNDIKKNGTDDLIVNVKADSWKSYRIMPGVYYSIPFSSSTRFELRPMISLGICKTDLPGFSYAYYYPDLSSPPNSVSKGKDKLPVTFCYRVSLGLDYTLGKKLFLSFDANYFGASPTLKYNYYPDWPQVTNLSAAEKHYSLASLNLLIGAGIKF